MQKKRAKPIYYYAGLTALIVKAPRTRSELALLMGLDYTQSWVQRTIKIFIEGMLEEGLIERTGKIKTQHAFRPVDLFTWVERIN